MRWRSKGFPIHCPFIGLLESNVSGFEKAIPLCVKSSLAIYKRVNYKSKLILNNSLLSLKNVNEVIANHNGTKKWLRLVNIEARCFQDVTGTGDGGWFFYIVFCNLLWCKNNIVLLLIDCSVTSLYLIVLRISFYIKTCWRLVDDSVSFFCLLLYFVLILQRETTLISSLRC